MKDVYAHLAGLCADVEAGRLEGAGTDEWTARQVDERKDRTLAENVAELREKGPVLVEALETLSGLGGSPSTSGPTSRTSAAPSASPAAATCRSWRGRWRS